jgi:hypothetical protein
MASETLTQSGRSLPLGNGIDFGVGMTDQNNVSQSVDVNGNNDTIIFNGWGPSTGTMTNVVLSQTNVLTFDVAGIGNITGNGNDDAYSGSGSFNLFFERNPITHQLQAYATNGKITLTYTD